MIIAVIQARMGSERLPGKVMKEVLGRPLIGYIFERLKRSKKIDKVILATSVAEANDPLCEYAKKQGVEVFRGSEDNVLERYYCAAKAHSPSAVMRLTGDCPLVDPDICDRLVEEFEARHVDHAVTGPSFAEGLDCEIFTFNVLETLTRKSTLQSEREHVTLYVRNHPDEFKRYQMPDNEDHSRYRIVVDDPEDFMVMKAILEYFYSKPNAFPRFSEVKSFLDRHPEVMAVNSHIIRNEGLIKSLAKDKKVV